MAKIRIKDLPKNQKISIAELGGIIGGATLLQLGNWPMMQASKDYTCYEMKSGPFSRSSYFDGQFLGTDDLEEEQEY